MYISLIQNIHIYIKYIQENQRNYKECLFKIVFSITAYILSAGRICLNKLFLLHKFYIELERYWKICVKRGRKITKYKYNLIPLINIAHEKSDKIFFKNSS